MSRKYQSRLKKIEERKNKHQAVMFVLLTMGFILLLIFVGFPLFVKGAIWLGDKKSMNAKTDKNDKVPPVPPTCLYVREATNSAKINLEGYSETDSVVSLHQNGEKITDTITNDNGIFEFNGFELKEGKNDIYFIAKDEADNISQKSKTYSIIYDKEKPELILDTPSDRQKFFDEDREILISGETEPDINLRVNNYMVLVDTEGNFVKRYNLMEGNNEIKVEAVDKAGNKSEIIINVEYQK